MAGRTADLVLQRQEGEARTVRRGFDPEDATEMREGRWQRQRLRKSH